MADETRSAAWRLVTGVQVYRWGFFFRVLGWGAAIQRDLPILFSEREGYRSRLRVGRWAFSFLRRSDGGMRLSAAEQRSLDATAEYERAHPIPPREDGCVYPECIVYDADQPCPCGSFAKDGVPL